ncbi:MAG: hypothetical protein M3Q80_01250 [bacterium]|nr:hypothetical protein [bacterium]
MESVAKNKILTTEQVIAELNKKGIDRTNWGVDPWRSFEDLMTYHTRDQLDFVLNDEPGLTIEVHAKVIHIYYLHKSLGWLELYEDHQVGRDKKILRRDFNGIAETKKRNEDSLESARRCLKEELGWDDPSKYQLTSYVELEIQDPKPSEKWENVTARYFRNKRWCLITDELYFDSYCENDNGRFIHFKWRPGKDPNLRIAA